MIITLLNFTLGITKAFANKKELAYSDSAGIPSGVIAMWSGQSTNIPDGWALCDGQNGTPNLTDRFIVGAGAKYSPGDTGGEETHTLTTAELPSHSHGAGGLSAASAGSHTHSYSYDRVWDSTYVMNEFRSVKVIEDWSSTSGTTGSSGAHTHTISGSTAAAGSGTAHNNMPPYYALCFIMKL